MFLGPHLTSETSPSGALEPCGVSLPRWPPCGDPSLLIWCKQHGVDHEWIRAGGGWRGRAVCVDLVVTEGDTGSELPASQTRAGGESVC